MKDNISKPRQLYRSEKNKLLAGVCGGLAEYFNQDPTIVRVIFVLLTLLYLVLWLILPMESAVRN